MPKSTSVTHRAIDTQTLRDTYQLCDVEIFRKGEKEKVKRLFRKWVLDQTQRRHCSVVLKAQTVNSEPHRLEPGPTEYRPHQCLVRAAIIQLRHYLSGRCVVWTV